MILFYHPGRKGRDISIQKNIWKDIMNQDIEKRCLHCGKKYNKKY